MIPWLLTLLLVGCAAAPIESPASYEPIPYHRPRSPPPRTFTLPDLPYPTAPLPELRDQLERAKNRAKTLNESIPQ